MLENVGSDLISGDFRQSKKITIRWGFQYEYSIFAALLFRNCPHLRSIGGAEIDPKIFKV